MIQELENISPGISGKTLIDTKRRAIRVIEVEINRGSGEKVKRDIKSNLQDSLVIGVEFPRQVIRERITRRFTYALGENIGPEHDIPAPDVNTNDQTMAWIADTYMSTKSTSERSKNQHVVTGKPVGSGGLEGRDRATGYGVFLTIKFWAEKNNESLKGKTFIVQGFGNVGYWAAHFLENEGAKMVGVQDAYGSVQNKDGITVEDLFNYGKANSGSIVGYPEARNMEGKDFFGLDCDICIPAALGNQITKENAHTIKASLIAEGANGPTDVEGEKILSPTGNTDILPTILSILGEELPAHVEGRILEESFKGSDNEIISEMKIHEASLSTEFGTYSQEITISSVGQTQYIEDKMI